METWDLINKYCEENFDNFNPQNYELDGSRIYINGTRECLRGEPNSWTESDHREVDLLDYITWVFNQPKQ